MATTIKDVAARAGLSVMTVSRVLNGQRQVSAEAREKVTAAVEALGYRRNAFARGLSRSRSFLICMIMPERIPDYVVEFQQGAIRSCRDNGYHLVVVPCDNGADTPANVVADAIATLRPDGLLLLPPITDDLAVLEVLDRSAVAYVRVAPGLELKRASSISMDDVEAARRMTLALLDLGHREIAFIAGPEEHAASGLRLHGYRLALNERGLAVESRLVWQGGGIFEESDVPATALLSAADRPSAVFAFNDETALAVMAAAYRLGLSIPRNLSVAGFDDGEIARQAWPPLTTVRQPIQAMAAGATEMIIAQADANVRRIEHRRLDFDLVFRGTTAAPDA